MKRPIPLDRPVKALVVATLTALALASAAGAQSLVGRPPDVRDVANTLDGGAFAGSPPAVRDAAAARVALPDVLERYAAAHPFGSGIGISQTAATVIGRPPDIADVAASLPAPDVFERYASAHPYGAGASSAAIQPTLVSRPPDVQDAAQTALTVSLTRPSGFSWGDWAIGIGSGLGIAVFLAGVLGLAMSRQRRQRVLTA